MSRLVFPAPLLSDARASLLQHADETCAVFYGSACFVAGKLARVVVREIENVPAAAYLRRSPVEAELSPDFVAHISGKARADNLSLVFVHTHPGQSDTFSEVDDFGEERLREFLDRRMGILPHVALVLTPRGSCARVLGSRDSLRIIEVGASVTEETALVGGVVERFDRQVRAFGADGQRRLSSMRVAIVGLGGTGSVVAQQLAHLGIRDFLLVDPDQLEATNLNRVVGASHRDVGRPKVEVATDHIRQLSPNAIVDAQQRTILGSSTARMLGDVDFAFCCTDSHGSRALMNQIAYQFLVPTIDVGVVIAANEGIVTHVAGRARLLAPSLGCVVCENLLNAEEVRRDFLSHEERKRDPYIVGTREPQPAVISLNSTIASLGVTMFLNAVTRIPGAARFLNYNGLTGTVRTVTISANPKCVMCSPGGCFARGDTWPISAREDW